MGLYCLDFRAMARLRLGDVLVRRDPGSVSDPRQPQRFFIRDYRRTQNSSLRVERPELKIVHSQFCFHAQTDIGQVRESCLCFEGIRFHGITNAAPEIGFPGRVERQ